jgi:HNH endonuclease
MSKKIPKELYDQRWIERVRADAVRLPTGCLVTDASKHPDGYAQTNYRAKTVRIHRVIYQLVHGVALPKGVAVCHSCDVRNCIEISHLWVGSWKDNLVDCRKKNRHVNGAKEVCKHGHEFTPDNTWLHTYKGNTRRHCRACQRMRQRMKTGWSYEEARDAEVIPANVITERRSFKFGRRNAA